MLGNTLLLPLTPEWGQKVNLFSVLKVFTLHIQNNENEAYNTMSTIDSCVGTKGKNFHFSEEGCVAYHILQLKCLTLCTPLAFWVG